jgi:hypothetical protein
MKGLSTFWWLVLIGLCIALLAVVESLSGVKMVAVAALFLAVVYGLDARLKANALIDASEAKEDALDEALEECRQQIQDLIQRVEIVEESSINGSRQADSIAAMEPQDCPALYSSAIPEAGPKNSPTPLMESSNGVSDGSSKGSDYLLIVSVVGMVLILVLYIFSVLA